MTIAHAGFPDAPPPLARRLGGRDAPVLRAHARARRNARAAPPRSARGGVLARRRNPLLRSLRLKGGNDRGDGARPQGQHRTAQQRGHGAAVGGRRAGGDGARERPPLPAAPHQGRRARAHAPVQREHPRVAERRPRRARSQRPRRPLEPADGGAVRRPPRGGGRPAARRAVRRAHRRHDPRGSTATATEGAAYYRIPMSTRHDPPRRLLVNVGATPLRDSARRDRRHHRHRRGHLDARAARGAAADLGEDGVDRPARRGRRARGQHAADRHLQLHADAAAAGAGRRSVDARCSRRSSGRPSAPRRSSTGC